MRNKLLVFVLPLTLLLAIAGIVRAYDILWSGQADVTIEAAEEPGSGNLVITDVQALDGSWSDSTSVWIVSLERGTSAKLRVSFQNDGGDVVTFGPYINGSHLQKEIATGVRVQTTGDLSSLAAGESGYITFTVDAFADAEPGTLPQITLEIRSD